MSDKLINVVYVAAQNHTFCIDTHFIKKIIELPELEILPGAPNDIAGSFVYGGKIIPAVDMAILMGLPRNELYGLSTIILLCADKKKQIGLIVDTVHDLDLIDIDIFAGSGEIESSNTNLLSVITINNKTIMVPAMEKIIARPVKLEQ